MGRRTNTQNAMVYMPDYPPTAADLELRLSPLHRAELIERYMEKGLPVPDRTLTLRDYLAAFRRSLTNPYAGTRYEAEWHESHPQLLADITALWAAFWETFE